MSWVPKTTDEIRELLKRTDTDDPREIYLAWNQLGMCREEIVPFVVEAFVATRSWLGRESQVYHVAPFARFNDLAVELGLRALRDTRKEIRYRACGLLAHSRRVEVIPELAKVHKRSSREAAQRAITALEEGRPFGGDGDPFYFLRAGRQFHGHCPFRAPCGSFADNIYSALGTWPGEHGFRPTYLFAHTLELGDARRVVRTDWDSYDLEARVFACEIGELAEASSDPAAWILGPYDIAAIAATIRRLAP